MPKLNDQTQENHKIVGANFGYSATKLDELGATEFTLVTIVNDTSGSVNDYKQDMESALKEIVNACGNSPRADFLLLRHLQFNDSVSETHGFKMLDTCKVADYDNCLNITGCTALFDASKNAILATGDYADKLAKSRYLVNAIVIVMTDGCDNASANRADDVKAALAKVMKDESLESILTILVAVGYEDAYSKDELDRFHKEAGFTQFVDIKDANAKNLAKLAQFVSQSVSSQSQALGTGGSSQPLTF